MVSWKLLELSRECRKCGWNIYMPHGLLKSMYRKLYKIPSLWTDHVHIFMRPDKYAQWMDIHINRLAHITAIYIGCKWNWQPSPPTFTKFPPFYHRGKLERNLNPIVSFIKGWRSLDFLEILANCYAVSLLLFTVFLWELDMNLLPAVSKLEEKLQKGFPCLLGWKPSHDNVGREGTLESICSTLCLDLPILFSSPSVLILSFKPTLT